MSRPSPYRPTLASASSTASGVRVAKGWSGAVSGLGFIL